MNKMSIPLVIGFNCDAFGDEKTSRIRFVIITYMYGVNDG